MSSRSGFTLIEVMMMILVLSALAVASIVTVSGDLDAMRQEETFREMFEIREALLGLDEGRLNRISFGYLGDLGGIPTAAQGGLAALWTQPTTLQGWTVSSTAPIARMGSGWNGSYLRGQGFLGADYSKDGWGNAYVYQGDSFPATILSMGSDGVVGGTGAQADIKMEIPEDAIRTRVNLVIQKSGAVWSFNADADLYYPDPANGSIKTSQARSSAASGLFVFPDAIPYGRRTVRFYFPDRVSPTKISGPYEVVIERTNPLVILGTLAKPIDVWP
jgi:type II secretory pathway pseudopilin PulG